MSTVERQLIEYWRLIDKWQQIKAREIKEDAKAAKAAAKAEAKAAQGT